MQSFLNESSEAVSWAHEAKVYLDNNLLILNSSHAPNSTLHNNIDRRENFDFFISIFDKFLEIGI